MSVQPEEPKTSPPVVEWAVHAVSRWLGSTPALVFVLGTVVIWLLSRPLFVSSEAWQNAILLPFNILTFVFIFLLQRSQNKAMLAIQLKLNEIVASQHGASNRLIDIENMSEEEVTRLHRHYQLLAAKTKAEENSGEFHTVEEAAHHEAMQEKK